MVIFGIDPGYAIVGCGIVRYEKNTKAESLIIYESENGELFAEVDEIKYRKHHYSGVNLPDYWEPYTETVIYKVNVNENGLTFTKTEK